MKRPLVYYGNPLLRKKSVKVEKINDEIKTLVKDMIETMDANNGVGLAAIQVGEPWRVIVIRPEIENESGKIMLGEPEVYINPVLSNPSSETNIFSEGCLSIPGIHREVERPKSIHVEAMDLEGNKISEDFEGFKAVEIMHENDHLNGVLFVDRLSKENRKKIEPYLKEIKKKYNK